MPQRLQYDVLYNLLTMFDEYTRHEEMITFGIITTIFVMREKSFAIKLIFLN